MNSTVLHTLSNGKISVNGFEKQLNGIWEKILNVNLENGSTGHYGMRMKATIEEACVDDRLPGTVAPESYLFVSISIYFASIRKLPFQCRA